MDLFSAPAEAFAVPHPSQRCAMRALPISAADPPRPLRRRRRRHRGRARRTRPPRGARRRRRCPSTSTISKAVLRALAPHGVTLRGDITDVMLQSYLVNPTHASHTLPDIAARSTNRALVHQPTKANPADPKRLPEAAAAIVRLARVFAEQMAESDAAAAASSSTSTLLSSRTLSERSESKAEGSASPATRPPAAPSLRDHGPAARPRAAAHGAGRRAHRHRRSLRMSTRLAVEMDTLAERIYDLRPASRFNINSPKQLGDVLFNKMTLPKPMKYGKGKVISTAQDVLEELAEQHPVPALVLEYRQLAKLRSTYLDSLPNLVDAEGRVHTTFNQVGTATGRLSSTNPNLQNIPVRTALGREIRAAFIPAPGNLLMSADYSQIELRLMAHFSQDPLLLNAYRTGPGHPHADRVGGLWHCP